MRRHGIAGTTVQFGVALWPYDLLLRFGYELPEHEHRWPGQWFDDRFEAAAFDVRATAAKLLLALAEMDRAVGRLRSVGAGAGFATTREIVESAPLTVDLVALYLRRMLDDLAAVVPCCYGDEGRAMADERDSIEALGESEALRKTDEDLADLLIVPGPLAAVVAPGFTAHTAELYAVSGGAGSAPALPRAASAALDKSAKRTHAAVTEIDGALTAAGPWLDAVLDHLITVVCRRAEDGPELRDRWAEPDWSVFATSAPAEALADHLPRC